MSYDYFRFWCQKVLPLVYDDSLSYYEVLCKVRDYLNHIIDDNKMITEDLGAINTKLDVVTALVDRIEAGMIGEKIIFIGDSYGTAARTTPWTDTFVAEAGLGEAQYINACQGGIGWTPGENGHTFLDRLQTAETTMSAAPYLWDGTEVTKIIVAGGVFRDLVNAEYNYSTLNSLIESRISAFMTYAKAHFPNAKVYYAYCSDCLNYGTEDTGGKTWQEMINVSYNYYYAAAKYGYILLPNVQYVLMRNFRLDLNELGLLHPNGTGGISLGTAIHSAVYGSWSDLISGSVDVDKGSDNGSDNCRIRLFAENGSAFLTFRDAANITIDSRSGQTYLLCSLPEGVAHRDAVNSFTNVRGVAFAQAKDASNNIHLIPVDIIGDGLDLKAQILGAYGNYTTATISPFTLQAERAKLFQNYSA